MATPQVNIRVPSELHDLIRQIASRLRDDPDFPSKLKQLLQSDADVVNELIGRVERLEAQHLQRDVELVELRSDIRQMVERLQAVEAAARKPARPLRGATSKAATAKASDDPGASDGPLVQGEGAGRRLTALGRAEVLRCLDAGDRVNDIAASIGVTKKSIYSLRQKRT